ncbi:hypothetical protein BSKO_13286 [Bryopsis sp. KO-2023]|nr:hypothetical protein BSKO_13286 [Bryopsis sp. KO-2023]
MWPRLLVAVGASAVLGVRAALARRARNAEWMRAEMREVVRAWLRCTDHERSCRARLLESMTGRRERGVLGGVFREWRKSTEEKKEEERHVARRADERTRRAFIRAWFSETQKGGAAEEETCVEGVHGRRDESGPCVGYGDSGDGEGCQVDALVEELVELDGLAKYHKRKAELDELEAKLRKKIVRRRVRSRAPMGLEDRPSWKI